MITRVLHLARREWLEQRRQPAMLGAIGALFALIAFLPLGILAVLELLLHLDPAAAATLGGVDWAPALAQSTVSTWSFLAVSQLIGFVAVLAGLNVLHDRQCGTLTFLLLAPTRRAELLLGKVLGALAPVVALHALAAAPTAALLLLSPLARAAGATPALSPAWWLALFVGAPLWTGALATGCALVSAVATDVRTAQQFVWFLVFFTTLALGALLVGALPYGAPLQLGVAALGAVAFAAAVGVGAQGLSQDVRR